MKPTNLLTVRGQIIDIISKLGRRRKTHVDDLWVFETHPRCQTSSVRTCCKKKMGIKESPKTEKQVNRKEQNWLETAKGNDWAVGCSREGGLEMRQEVSIIRQSLFGGQVDNILGSQGLVAEGQSFPIVAQFPKNEEAAPIGSQDVLHEATHIPEGVDRTLVSGVKENRALAPVAQLTFAGPLLVVQEVSLLESSGGVAIVWELKVVEGLGVVKLLVGRRGGLDHRDCKPSMNQGLQNFHTLTRKKRKKNNH